MVAILLAVPLLRSILVNTLDPLRLEILKSCASVFGHPLSEAIVTKIQSTIIIKTLFIFTRIDLNNGTARPMATIKDMIPLEHATTMDIGTNTIYSIGKRDSHYFLNAVDVETVNFSSIRLVFPVVSLKVSNEQLFGVVQLPDSYILARIDAKNGNIYRLEILANADIKVSLASAIDTFTHKYFAMFSVKGNSFLISYDILNDKSVRLPLPSGYTFYSLELNPAGSRLLTLASNAQNNSISICDIDITTGQLTEKMTIPDYKSAVAGVSALCVPCACPTQIYFAPVKTSEGFTLVLINISGKAILSSYKLELSPLAFALIP